MRKFTGYETVLSLIKRIKSEINKKVDKTDIPTSLPANGGNADTVDGYTSDQLIQGNPNLLNNPDFKINQRGQNEYSAALDVNAIPTIDRWKLARGSKVTVFDDYIRIEYADAANKDRTYRFICQRPEFTLSDQQITMSVMARGIGKMHFGRVNREIKTIDLISESEIKSIVLLLN